MAKYRKVQVEYVIAGILLMYTFFSENVMLTGNTNYIVWGGVKIALVLFSISFIKELKKVFYHKNSKRIFMILITYSFINIIVFRLIYPGNWCGDELWMLPNVTGYYIVSAQHWLTACFYIASFMLFPSPIGVYILFQAVILYILMYVLRIFSDRLNNKKYVWGILLSLCTGNVLLYNFYPLRCSIYGWFLILLFVSVFMDEERAVYKIITSSVLICSLRSEGMIWLFVIGGIMLIRKSKINQIRIMAIIVALSGIIIKYQNRSFSGAYGDYNLMTAVLDPMKELAQKEYHMAGRKSELLEDMDDTIDVDVLLHNSGSGMGVFFAHYEELFRNDKPAIAPDFIKAHLRLIVKYPLVFLNERKTTFIHTMKQTSLILCNNTQSAFADDEKEPYVYVKHFNGFHVKNSNLRTNTLDCLSLKNCNPFVRQICTGLFLPACFVWIGICSMGKKRKWDELIFLTGIWLYTAVVILTMPGMEFMYFYPVYLFGMFYGNWMLLQRLDKKYLCTGEKK